MIKIDQDAIIILMDPQQKTINWEWNYPRIKRKKKLNWNPKIEDFNFNYEQKNRKIKVSTH